MTKLDFNKIITVREFKENIDEEKLKDLYDIATTIISKERKRLVSKNHNTHFRLTSLFSAEYICKRSREISEITYSKMNPAEREFLAISIMYNSNESVIRYLQELGITYEHLKIICTNISAYKKIFTENPNDEKFESSNYIKTENFLINISKLAKRDFSCIDYYLTINKLMYLVAFEKDLYLSMQKTK